MKTTKSIISYSIMSLFALFLSCSKEEYNTPHPDKGVIAVNINYPQGAEEDDYTVEVDGQPLDEGDNASNPLAPGEHTVLVYNTPEGFTVTDGIAYVERVDGTRALTDLIDPLPETLYSGTKPLRVHSPAWRGLTTCAVKRFMARRSAPPPCSPAMATRYRQTCDCWASWATGRR